MSPRATRNSRDLITQRSSRAAWEVEYTARPSRSGRVKRKSYREDSDSEADSDTTQAKRLKDVQFFHADEVDMEDDHGDVEVSTSPITVSDDEQEDGVVRAGGKVFDKLPLEVHAIIISYIERDSDILHYGMVCKRLYYASHTFIWSERYAKTYDVDCEPQEDDFGELKSWREIAVDDYKSRHISFNHGWLTFSRRNLRFDQDHKGREKLWLMQMTFLSHLRNMIYESDARVTLKDDGSKVVGKNFDLIHKITSRGSGFNYIDVLDSLLEQDNFTTLPRGKKRGEKPRLTMMVQLCLLPMILDLDHIDAAVSHWDGSQKLVYSLNEKMFEGLYKNRIKLNFFVNTLNFFKFHFKTGNGEGILHEAYSKLPLDQRPQMWCGKVPVGSQAMVGHWKGAWSYLSADDLVTMRTNYASRESYQDTVDMENYPFFDMTFFSDESIFGAEQWPTAWNTWVVSDPYANLSKGVSASRPELKHFWGSIRGSKEGHIFGRTHAITNQDSFHGWQHISMMVCFSTDQGAFDEGDFWIYEGISLPGNRIIMGRWSQPPGQNPVEQNTQCGPFIFWNVDRSVLDPQIDPAEAWEFSATINNPMFSGLPTSYT